VRANAKVSFAPLRTQIKGAQTHSLPPGTEL
jgi:hypothetical protein